MIRPKQHLENVFRNPGYEAPRQDYLRLDMNENAEGLPAEFVADVLACVTPNTLATYPSYGTLVDKIAASEGLAADNVQLANGSDSAIKLLFEAYIGENEEVVLTDPTFAMYPVYSEIVQGKTTAVPYEEPNTFPIDAFINAITSNTRMAVVVNPNNPTGAHLPQHEIRRIATHCQQTNTLLVVDEAYYHYLEETAVALVSEFEHVIVLRTFSKLCGLATLRLGYALAHQSIIKAIRAVKPTFDVNGLAVLFAEKLLDSPEITKSLLAGINEGRNFLVNKLDIASLSYHAGKANFILINCPHDATKTAALLKEKGILVASGFRQKMFTDCIRVTLGNIESMTRFWEAFQQTTNQ